jgi:acyl-CoA synthetase (NDP forming)
VSGRRCYASIAELPKAPDVAVFCVGYARILDPFLVDRLARHTAI